MNTTSEAPTCPKCGRKLSPGEYHPDWAATGCPASGCDGKITHAGTLLPARARLVTGTPVLLDNPGGDDFDIQWMPPGEQTPCVTVGEDARDMNFSVKPEHAITFNVDRGGGLLRGFSYRTPG